jgi:hypothetical protein
MMSYKPNASPAEIIGALIETAENPETSGRNDRYGHHGIINTLTAINRLALVDTLTAINRLAGTGGSPTPVPPPPSCNSGSLEFELTFNTDGYGEESTWELTHARTGATVASGGPYGDNNSYLTRECLPPGQCYTLTILDLYGDGSVQASCIICSSTRDPSK